MKRTLIVAGAVLVLGVSIYVGKLWAQNNGEKRPTPQLRTRIALVNLSYVLKYYQKNVKFQKEMKAIMKPFTDKLRMKSEERDRLTKEARNPATPADQRADISKKLRDLTREIQDLQHEFRSSQEKRVGEHLTDVYKEIYGASRRYALAHNYELVLHYNDALTEKDFYSPANVMRKLQMGGTAPMYYSDGMEISRQVVQALNATYR